MTMSTLSLSTSFSGYLGWASFITTYRHCEPSAGGQFGLCKEHAGTHLTQRHLPCKNMIFSSPSSRKARN